MDQKTGISFVKLSKARVSYDTYTVLYHIDIAQYKNITKAVEAFYKYANNECDTLGSHSCKAMLDQAGVLLNHMKQDESDIEAYQQDLQNKRNRRALEFIGDFHHWAFGLMNAESAREYNQKIENLQNNTERMHNLMNEQTLLIKESLILNNKTAFNLDRQVKKISTAITQYREETFIRVNWVQAELTLTESATIIKMMETEHRRITLQIMKCLEEIASGKITQLIPRDRLVNDLLYIERHLKEEQKLPIDFMTENPLHTQYQKIY